MIKQYLGTIDFTVIAIIAGTIILIALGLMAANSYFNYQEIQTLVSGADARGLDYELVIHNQLTNTYSFSINE